MFTELMLITIVSMLAIGIITSAILTIIQINAINAVIVSGIMSLFIAIMFLILAAPDVAMTEAAIGSGLTTVIFLYAIAKTKLSKSEN